MESSKKELRIIVPKELYHNFQKKCKFQFKSMSEVIRDFMLKYKGKNE